jgi:DNA-directed RNA polymerase specialized sigma24 family protein
MSAEAQSLETFADAAANNDIDALRARDEVGELLRRLPARQREALEALKLKEMSLAEASAVSRDSPWPRSRSTLTARSRRCAHCSRRKADADRSTH